MRSDLEELLGLKDEAKLGDAESRPLLLSVVESYLKAEVSRQCCTLRWFLFLITQVDDFCHYLRCSLVNGCLFSGKANSSSNSKQGEGKQSWKSR
jgi:hypothetical protein